MTIACFIASLRSKLDRQGLELLGQDVASLSDKTEFERFLNACSGNAGGSQWAFTRYIHDHKLLPLANSDLAAIIGGWGGVDAGVEVSFCSLKVLFQQPKANRTKELKRLFNKVKGFLLCGPVYFGDRSSLAQDLIQTIRADVALHALVRNKYFGGIAVGAKRNGGQETALIYQILDMVELGCLAVGNDSTSTSQYGGTFHAGNAGTAADDAYGMKTALGTGARLGTLVSTMNGHRLQDRLKVCFLLLQDKADFAKERVRDLMQRHSHAMDSVLIDVTKLNLKRCLGCSVCPFRVAPDEDYACRVGKGDAFCEIHPLLLDKDVIIPVTYSPKDVEGIASNYQRFMERTRYLRRADYILTDAMILPLVYSDIQRSENMHIRVITSCIRHHTIILKPITGWVNSGVLLNESQIDEAFRNILESSKSIAANTIMARCSKKNPVMYNPVGYVLKNEGKDNDIQDRERMLEERRNRYRRIASARVCGCGQ